MKDYYKPPREWLLPSIQNLYNQNVSKSPLSSIDFEQFEQMSDIGQTKLTLIEISNRLKLQDKAAIAVTLQFLVSPVYFHYSGYIKESMARRIKHCDLSRNQALFLINGLRDLSKYKTGKEFIELKKLSVYFQKHI